MLLTCFKYLELLSPIKYNAEHNIFKISTVFYQVHVSFKHLKVMIYDV